MTRLRAAIVKETWALIRDPKGRIMLVLPPIIQLFLFAFAATLEISNANVGVLDQSGGRAAFELTARLQASDNFAEVRRLASYDELEQAIDDQEIIAGIVLTPDFDRSLTRGRPAPLGVILDGRRSNAAQIVGSYIQEIAIRMGVEQQVGRPAPPDDVVVRHWFNPGLDFLWFNIPALAVLIVSVSGVAITAQSVARERELGTFDQLMVSPLRVHEILIGKMVPPFFLAILNGSIFLVAAPIFGVPFTGSLALFYTGLSIYAVSLIGFGMLVSSLSMTQQQAFLGSFALTIPIIMLSGFAAPISNMPEWLQPFTYLFPVRYFLEVSLGLFLKDMPASAVFMELWPLGPIAMVTVGASAWLFRARME